MTDYLTSLKRDIFDCEVQVWEALVAGDAVADAAALADGFLGVYHDGFAGKADHVGQLADGPTVRSYVLSDVHLIAMGAAHALISYRAEFIAAGKAVPQIMFVSSVWERQGAVWRNIFSQDTAETPA